MQYFGEIIDEKGEIGIENKKSPAIWNLLVENGSCIAKVKKDSLWGVINMSGEIIQEPIYNEIDIDSSNMRNATHYLRTRLNNKYGLLDQKGITIAEPKYEKLEFCTNRGMAKVWVDEEFWFYIDRKGREYFRKNQK